MEGACVGHGADAGSREQVQSAGGEPDAAVLLERAAAVPLVGLLAHAHHQRHRLVRWGLLGRLHAPGLPRAARHLLLALLGGQLPLHHRAQGNRPQAHMEVLQPAAPVHVEAVVVRGGGHVRGGGRLPRSRDGGGVEEGAAAGGGGGEPGHDAKVRQQEAGGGGRCCKRPSSLPQQEQRPRRALQRQVHAHPLRRCARAPGPGQLPPARAGGVGHGGPRALPGRAGEVRQRRRSHVHVHGGGGGGGGGAGDVILLLILMQHEAHTAFALPVRQRGVGDVGVHELDGALQQLEAGGELLVVAVRGHLRRDDARVHVLEDLRDAGAPPPLPRLVCLLRHLPHGRVRKRRQQVALAAHAPRALVDLESGGPALQPRQLRVGAPLRQQRHSFPSRFPFFKLHALDFKWRKPST
mmetsp:Transcript_40143/g.76730  ORF Transcript_40143/g.76730 Transcript_40143/m.76730 type:complete len:409 (-) Transcript_40143:635-1861(-)